MNDPIPARARLRPLLQRQRATRLWFRMALCWLAGCVLGLTLFLLRGAAPGTDLLLPIVLMVITVSSVVAVWILHRKSKLDWQACAKSVEAQYPELDGRLLTAIEQEPDESGRLGFLQEQLSREVLAHARLVPWEQLIPRSRVGLTKLTHAIALSAFLVTFLRLMSLPASEGFGLAEAADVEIKPGDTALERGDSLVITVRFNREVPTTVDLTVRDSAGTSQRLPLVRSLEDPIFGTSIPSVTNDLTYSVSYRNKRSRDFKVTVFDYPKLERSDVALNYPDYTRLAPKTIGDTRRVTAVEGTRLNLALLLNKPVEEAHLIPRSSDDDPIDLGPTPESTTLQLTGLVLSASQRYTLRLKDTDGRTNREPPSFVFNVFSNKPPDLKITAPQGDIRPSALEEVAFSGTVEDDFGVLAYGFAYSVSGQPIHTIELGSNVQARSKESFDHLMEIEELGVSPGDLVSWFYWSEDVGPDGSIRRTMGDLYFAEIRPFEEIFRQGQSQFGGSEQEQSQGGSGGGQAAQLVEIQQQIIHATWKLQREQAQRTSPSKDPSQSSIPQLKWNPIEPHNNETRPSLNPFLREMIDSTVFLGSRQSGFFGQRQSSESSGASEVLGGNLDLQVIIDAQQQAIEQAQDIMNRQPDPRRVELWAEAIDEMETALAQLQRVAETPSAWEPALAAQQAAYQRLLQLQADEFSVSQNQGQGSSSSQSARQRQMQSQLDELDLKPEEDRYETERLASAPQSEAQREQLQVMSRLAELARRQEDINKRLQELQTALEAAASEELAEEARRELKRLQEEQRRMLEDLDELQQRMQSSENTSQFTQQQEQLEQTRESIQRASEAADEGSVSEALAAGTRAQSELQEMREELRSQSASAFADDMRQLRAEARELSRQQRDIQEELERAKEESSRRLGGADPLEQLSERLDEQRDRLVNLVDQASAVSELAEAAEPLMSSTLYDTLREFSQDDEGAVKALQEDLLSKALFPLYEHLKEVTRDSETKTLDATSAILEQGFVDYANQLGREAQSNTEDLAQGIERAAEMILGDDTEALRRAEMQLEELARQLEEEIARAENESTNGATARASSASDPSQPGSPSETASQEPAGTDQAAGSGDAEGARDSQPGSQTGQSPGGSTAQQQSPAQSPGSSPQPGDPQNTPSTEGQPGSPSTADLDRFLRGRGWGSGGGQTGPITGEQFGPWSDRLREVEEMVELTDLRNDLIRAREQARQFRREYARDQKKPDWARVRLNVLNPLLEVRSEIDYELSRRQSDEKLVPIDRDPVPERFSEVVRQYYEELGSDEE